MAFMDWIADWAEEHIPLLGGWIATLVRMIQGAIEGAYGWVKKAVSWIENTWIPWAEGVINSISLSLSNAWNRIKQHIEPTLDALERGWNWLEDKVKNLDEEFSNFIRNLPQIIYDNIPDWIKNGVKNALDEISKIWTNIKSLDEYISTGLNYLEDLIFAKVNEVSSTIKSWVTSVVEPIKERLSGLESKLKAFLDDPVGYIRSAMDPVIQGLSQELSEFSSWVQEKVSGFIDAISSIDDFILSMLEVFILSLITWFIGTFIDDLAHLEYDPETKQVYGKPKNPITHILIWFFEVEKPENPYKSVKDKMGVKEVRGAEYARPR